MSHVSYTTTADCIKFPAYVYQTVFCVWPYLYIKVLKFSSFKYTSLGQQISKECESKSSGFGTLFWHFPSVLHASILFNENHKIRMIGFNFIFFFFSYDADVWDIFCASMCVCMYTSLLVYGVLESYTLFKPLK